MAKIDTFYEIIPWIIYLVPPASSITAKRLKIRSPFKLLRRSNSQVAAQSQVPPATPSVSSSSTLINPATTGSALSGRTFRWHQHFLCLLYTPQGCRAQMSDYLTCRPLPLRRLLEIVAYIPLFGYIYIRVYIFKSIPIASYSYSTECKFFILLSIAMACTCINLGTTVEPLQHFSSLPLNSNTSTQAVIQSPGISVPPNSYTSASFSVSPSATCSSLSGAKNVGV